MKPFSIILAGIVWIAIMTCFTAIVDDLSTPIKPKEILRDEVKLQMIVHKLAQR